MTAPDKLDAYLRGNGVSKVWFAKRCGVNRTTLHKWINGHLPSMTARLVIQDATDGAVRVEDWEN